MRSSASAAIIPSPEENIGTDSSNVGFNDSSDNYSDRLLGAVVIDVTRTSEIEFQSFENSCLVALEERKRLASVKSIEVVPGLVLPRNEWGWGYGLVVDIQASRGRVMSEEKRQMDLPAADLRFHSKQLRYDSDVRIDVWNLSLGLRPTHTRQ